MDILTKITEKNWPKKELEQYQRILYRGEVNRTPFSRFLHSLNYLLILPVLILGNGAIAFIPPPPSPPPPPPRPRPPRLSPPPHLHHHRRTPRRILPHVPRHTLWHLQRHHNLPHRRRKRQLLRHHRRIPPRRPHRHLHPRRTRLNPVGRTPPTPPRNAQPPHHRRRVLGKLPPPLLLPRLQTILRTERRSTCGISLL